LAVYNYGAPKQIEAVYKVALMRGYLLLFSAPETYGPSHIVGHYDKTTSPANVADNMRSGLIAD
jgi:hypothetical protein